jgi:signal transduction histidine kinase
MVSIRLLFHLFFALSICETNVSHREPPVLCGRNIWLFYGSRGSRQKLEAIAAKDGLGAADPGKSSDPP